VSNRGSCIRLSALIVVATWLPLSGQSAQTPPATPTAVGGTSVPSDLRPLLVARSSEMRLVSQRYAADRALLSGNYLGGGRGGGRGGRGGPAPSATDTAPALSVSPNRLARLKRFDLDWRAALDKVDASKLSAAAKADLAALRDAISKNGVQLDADAAAISRLSPLLPFSPRVIALYESRVRMEDVDSQKAAGELTAVMKEVTQVRAKLESGLGEGSAAAGLRADRETALAAAAAVDTLHASLTEWFNFFNGYDPLFTWWMGLPFKHVDGALRDYAAFLRDKVAAANSPATSSPAATPVSPAPPVKFASVPDLAEILALPQDEMTAIVGSFRGRPGGGRGGGRGDAPDTRPPSFYPAWLAALKTLDFDALTRNAQVDYLFIKRTSEVQIARAKTPVQTDIPRKKDATGITGDARGRVGLLHDLADEMVPYTPEELIAIGYKELEWLEREMKKASAEMGFGENWKAAVEKVKSMHPPPGGKPAAVRDMLYEAVDYLRKHDLVTVPAVAAESLQMSMMSPERQLINPFFTGGARITVSFPTNTMEYEARLQSMRGNNIPFNHATAHHEMIPGHNLTGYMGSRYASYRPSLGGTPFFGEGWALYWELILYDKGFHDTPEERVGALFWRMHRAARIIFSMNFHLGRWSPQECIDFLVDRVAHERDNATAEVRRSFQQAAPLYQAAYLLGGLQIRSLRRELVESRAMTEKQFHDEILRQGNMPIALHRLAISKMKLTRDTSLDWRFYGEIDAK
jgi:Bacterial protein of unknown function (DUF885)